MGLPGNVSEISVPDCSLCDTKHRWTILPRDSVRSLEPYGCHTTMWKHWFACWFLSISPAPHLSLLLAGVAVTLLGWYKMEKVQEQAHPSEDVVLMDGCGEPSEGTESTYMALILESVDFGKLYSKDVGNEREGVIEFEFGDDSQEVALGFTTKVGFNVPLVKQLFAVQQTQKFSNALLYVGERKPLKLKVRAELSLRIMV